jgi:predicted nucleic acid-binding Zn ribbon protein
MTRCGFFSKVSPHHHIVVCLISQIRRILGQYSISQYLLRQCGGKGNERCILSFRRVCTTIKSQDFSLVSCQGRGTNERATERTNERTKTFTLFSQFVFSLLPTDYVLSLREVLFVVFFSTIIRQLIRAL